MKTQFEIWLEGVNNEFDGKVYSWKPLTFKKGSKFCIKY